MIAELFYPRELKIVIAELKEKGDLNEKALKTLYSTPYVFVFIWLVGTIIFWVILSNEFELGTMSILFVSFGLSIILFFVMWLDIRRVARMMLVYQNGKYRNGIVQKILYKARSPVAKIVIKDVESKESVPIGYFSEWYSKKQCPNKNDEVYYFSVGDGCRENMPDRMEIKMNYCLSIKIIKGERHA
ncbi:MAG: hypothetical protein ACRBCS_06640 [Cellvibrionaceae bacterium]